MKSFGLGKYALSGGVALALLAGCGGLQTISPPTEQQTNLAPAHPLANGYKVLYSFKGGADGEYPWAGLVNVKGTLYGTTEKGGANNDGTVFRITTSGKKTVLHSFGGSGDGEYPWAGLINVNGTLYGTTFGGGAYSSSCSSEYCGYGTVFSITLSGTETVLYSFKGSRAGEGPYAGLIDVKGTLYGTTLFGGGNNEGTVFSVTPSGTETVLHRFGGSGDGADPYASLIDVKGTLYGTTYAGGANGCRYGRGCGTVFSISPRGKETVLHSFGGSGDGEYPWAGLINVNGTLYGTTTMGPHHRSARCCGTVFSGTPSGTETVLYRFKGSHHGDGDYPQAILLNVNGTLYGTTYAGGNGGTLFSVTMGGKEKVLHNFGGSGDGGDPAAGLIDVKGMLYGTTVFGGTGGGTVFSLTP